MKTMNEQQLAELENDLNAIRDEVLADLGERDARYIRRIVRLHRGLEIGGRVLMPFGFIPPVFVAATAALGLSKIIENMEIGHNVMHGQYDWMNDPHINSRKFEWDHACDSDSWRRYHNFEHHTYTNVIGKDRDFGYGLLRLSDDYAWRPKNTWQFLTFVKLSVLFEWGVAYHELAAERIFFGKPRKESSLPISRQALKQAFFRKAGRQLFKDYIFFPLLFWPVALQVLLGNLTANLLRNLWTAMIIFCGHFTENIHTFREQDIQGETRAQWYYRQILGSSNLQGSKLFHILTGHLSCQIEHHLFPDIPAPRYRAMAPQVQAICARYGIPYNTGRFGKQYSTVLKRILRYSLPSRTASTQSAQA